MSVSWVIVMKEAPMHPRPVTEPTLAWGPACQLLFLRPHLHLGPQQVSALMQLCIRVLRPISPMMIQISTIPGHHWKYSLYGHLFLPSRLLILIQTSSHLAYIPQLSPFPLSPPTTPAPKPTYNLHLPSEYYTHWPALLGSWLSCYDSPVERLNTRIHLE